MIYSIAYARGIFVAGGDDCNITYSEDGINWTAVGALRGGTGDIYGIAYGNGKFVAVTNDGVVAYSATITAQLVYKANGDVQWVKG